MTISVTDVKFRKSATVTDTGVNGGRKGRVEKLTGSRHALFPRVSKTDRLNGLTRYRKEFWANENAADEVAYDLLVWLEFPSLAGDRFYLGQGTQTDIQDAIVATPPMWRGCGQLVADLSGGETSLQLSLEADDYEFEPGGVLHLADKILSGQTIDPGVHPGDSVELTGATWYKIAPTGDIAHPKGVYVGTNRVFTAHGSSNEEFIPLLDNLTSDESIGTGNGTDFDPTLTDLANVTNGLVLQNAYRPVITTVCGGVEQTVYIEPDGTCSGFCTAGEINPATGVWITDIAWTTQPDNAEDITITYRDKNYSQSGNTYTLQLDQQVAHAFQAANTYGAGCLRLSAVEGTFEQWTVTSATGTYDEALYPPVMTNLGTEQDIITVTMLTATTFSCSGVNFGDLGTGDIANNFAPLNPVTGDPILTLNKDGWGGTWAANDRIQFVVNPAALPIWWKEIVPAGTPAESDNTAILGWYCE